MDRNTVEQDGPDKGKPYRDDAKEFEKLVSQFKQSGFSDAQVQIVWETVSAVLLMGNINVAGADGSIKGDTAAAVIVDQDLLKKTADLLHISAATLEKAFTKKTLSGAKKIVTDLSVDGAINAIHTFATNIYNGLFVWLVSKISDELHEDSQPASNASVSVLDIFGFEFTPLSQLKPPVSMNSFEQYCINFCNEKLQGHFVDCVLKSEQAVYKSELGETVAIDFEDNKPTLQTIKRISRLLDDVTNSGRDETDLELHEKFAREFDGGNRSSKKDAESPVIRMVDALRGHGKEKGYHNKEGYGFVLKHYAAEVVYDELGWLDKNKGKLSEDINDAFEASGTEFPGAYFKEYNAHHSANKTVASDFSSALDTLLTELQDCECQFTRCIKSNRAKVKNLYEGALVLNQLRYTGMLDTLIIRRKGYPIRMSHREFLDKFNVLHPDAKNAQDLLKNIKTLDCYKNNTKGKDESVRIGKTLVLLRDEISRALGVARDAKLLSSAVIIQSVWYACENAKIYKTKREIARHFGPMIKGESERHRFKEVYRDKFEKFERSRIQNFIRATVHRQCFYELKKRYLLQTDKLKELEEAHMAVNSLHQNHIEGLSALLESEKRKLDTEIKNIEDARDKKTAMHEKKLAVIMAENSKKEKEIEAKEKEINAQKEVLNNMQDDSVTKQKVLEQAAVAAELAWKQRTEHAEEKLRTLMAQPPILTKEGEHAVAQAESELAAVNAANASEVEELHRKHDSILDNIKHAEEEYASIKEEGEEQEEKNRQQLSYLQEEMATIDQRHDDEKTRLAKELASQNFKLAALRTKEAQAEDQYNTLQKHGAIGVFGTAPQQREIDILESKIDQAKYKLKEMTEQYAHKAQMVSAAAKAEKEAAHNWEIAKTAHLREVSKLKTAIAEEQTFSDNLDKKIESVDFAPQARRISRFGVSEALTDEKKAFVKAEEDRMKKAEEKAKEDATKAKEEVEKAKVASTKAKEDAEKAKQEAAKSGILPETQADGTPYVYVPPRKAASSRFDPKVASSWGVGAPSSQASPPVDLQAGMSLYSQNIRDYKEHLDPASMQEGSQRRHAHRTQMMHMQSLEGLDATTLKHMLALYR